MLCRIKDGERRFLQLFHGHLQMSDLAVFHCKDKKKKKKRKSLALFPGLPLVSEEFNRVEEKLLLTLL